MTVKSKLRMEQIKQALDGDVTFTGSGSRQLIKLDQDGNVILGDATAGVQIDGAVSGTQIGLGTGKLLTQSNTNTPADDDFLRINGTQIEGLPAADVMAALSGTASADFSLNTNKLTGVAAPTAGTDAANKDYVDARAAGLDPKESVHVATTANLGYTYDNANGTLTNGSTGEITIDGFTLNFTGARVLVKNQTNAVQNGIYEVTTVGDGSTALVLTRSDDMDTASEASNGVFVFVVYGTDGGGNGYLMSHNNNSGDDATLGTHELTFTQFTGAGSFVWGDGLQASGNTISVDLDASGGLEINSGELRIDVEDSSLTLNGNGVSVNLKTSGGIVHEVTNGLKIDLSASAVEGITRFSGATEKNTIVRSGSVLAANNDLTLADSGNFTATDFRAADEEDREIYLNGLLLLEGASASDNNDWYPGTNSADIKFEFDIEVGDIITLVYRKA